MCPYSRYFLAKATIVLNSFICSSCLIKIALLLMLECKIIFSFSAYVFFKLYKSLKKFKFQSAFSTYLYRTNLNTANSWFTRNKWKKLLHLDQILNQQTIDQSVEKEWINKELWDAISKLPKKQRSVVIMRIAEGLSYKEISVVTGMSDGTAKVNFHHALNTLKGVLNYE